MKDLIDESRFTRLLHIRSNIKEYKALVKFWEILETEELILISKDGEKPHG